jgi:hypothetical protein
MTYFWPGGLPIRVVVDEGGRPIRIVWNRQQHTIATVALGWLIDDQWWAERVWRLYYLVVTQTGHLLVIFRNLITNTWYVERLYD